PPPPPPVHFSSSARLSHHLPSALPVTALPHPSTVWVSPNVTAARVCLHQPLRLGALKPMWQLLRRRDDHPQIQHRHIEHDPTVDQPATWQVRARTLLSLGQYWSQYDVARPVE